VPLNHTNRSSRDSAAAPLGLALAAALAAALFARLYQIGQQIPMDDEWHAVAKAASSSYGEIVLSFGLADHSIPVALAYRALIGEGLLSEAWMQGPSLVAGIATLVLLVAAVRQAVTPLALGLFAALLAVSPLLVLYSRQARPYALALALALVAAWAAWQWWRGGRARHAVLYIACGPLAIWLHMTVAPFVLGVWIVFLAEWLLDRRRDSARFVAMAAVGALAVFLTAALIGPPLVHDFANMRAKAAGDVPDLHTLVRMAALYAGTASSLPALALSLLAVPGVILLSRAAPQATRFVAALLLLQAAAVLASRALLLQYALVLGRYLLVCLPFFLLAAAVGLAWVLSPLARLARGVPWLAGAGLVAGLVALGPLPRALAYPDNFIGHHLDFFDFAEPENRVAAVLNDGPVPAFYRRLGEEPPGSRVLIEAPWRYESIFNRLPVFQRVHRQRVKIGMTGGLCPPGAPSEFARQFPGRFRQFVDLSRPADELRGEADYVVFHRALELPNLTKPWQYEGGRALPAVDGCIEKFLATFGPPVFEDAWITVFALRPR
jgi:hypothetical protein